MVPITALWLPILLSAVLVFVASAIIHTLLPYHWNDYRSVPDEDRLLATLREAQLPPGDYMVPRPSSRRAMGEAAYQEKVRQGPVAMITIAAPSHMQMGRTLATWFVFLVAVGMAAAYLTGRTLPAGADYLAVFRVSGTTAFIAHSFALWQTAIWYSRSWSTTLKSTFDGLIYGLLTAGAFGWLWP